ncbi:hypothetical protein NCS56_01096200 [Fusarium sp. Ph1]|nr:hypothetical protein NCS56_01096200 [Fusarium sp. Ph1]
MAADEATSDPDPTGAEIPPTVEEEEEEKANPTEDNKVTERLMQRADADANEDSTRDGGASEGVHPNSTKAKDSDHEKSNPK